MSESSVPMYCRICRLALNELTRDGATGYVHAVTAVRRYDQDHTPDPVPLAQLPNPRILCDFCSEPDPPWQYPTLKAVVQTRNVVTRTSRNVGDYRAHHDAAREHVVSTAPGFTQDTGKWWAACPPCADLIDAGDLAELINRVVDAMPAKLTRPNRLAGTRAEVRRLYEDLLPHLGLKEPNPYYPST